MTEAERQFFAVVPIHGKFGLIESESMEEVKKGVAEVLERPKRDYPNYDFEKDIILIKGERVVWERHE